jgi:hypothetical protein
LLDDPVHHTHVFGETAAGRLEAGRTSNLLIDWALRERFVTAVVALTAGNVMKDDQAVSGLEVTNALADGRDYS